MPPSRASERGADQGPAPQVKASGDGYNRLQGIRPLAEVFQNGHRPGETKTGSIPFGTAHPV